MRTPLKNQHTRKWRGAPGGALIGKPLPIPIGSESKTLNPNPNLVPYRRYGTGGILTYTTRLIKRICASKTAFVNDTLEWDLLHVTM